MSKIDDLKAADTANAAATAAALAEMKDLAQQNADAMAKLAGMAQDYDDSADLQTEIEAMAARTTALNDGIAAVQQAVSTAPSGGTTTVAAGALGSGVTSGQSQVQGGSTPSGDVNSASTIGVSGDQATTGATAPQAPAADSSGATGATGATGFNGPTGATGATGQ